MNKFRNLFFSSCSFMALGFDIFKLYQSEYSTLLKLGIFGSAFLFIVLYLLYSKASVIKNRVILFLSCLFAFFMIFGNSYMQLGNASLIFHDFFFFLLSVFMALGYFFLFRILLSVVFTFLDTGIPEDKKFSKKFSWFSKHPFLFSFLFILICWLPYIISFYPIILSPDPSFQIKQFFGIRTKYADYAVLLDENVVLTNHHPVAHTMLLGGCLKFGHMLGNDNFGLFCFSFLQIIVLTSVFSLSIFYMKKMKISSKYQFLVLFIYGLVPFFPLYAMSAVKDVLFSAFTFLYIMMIHFVLKNQEENHPIWHYIVMIVDMLLVILFRNNGLHMILLSFPFVILLSKKYRKYLFLVFVIVLGLSTCYSKVLLPYFRITPGSIREMLSVPFQQTARLAKYHGDSICKEDQKIIDQVLEYDTLAKRYNPELADPVKNKFNKYASSDDLKKYFGVWFRGLLKYPVTYVDATINNVYGFFYPNKTNWYVYYKYDTRIVADGFDYHYNSLDSMRSILSGFAVGFPQIPVLGLFANIGFSVWVVFILVGYAIYRKWYSTVVIYLPALILILVCIVGPANTYFRYALPFIIALPFMISCILEKSKV